MKLITQSLFLWKTMRPPKVLEKGQINFSKKDFIKRKVWSKSCWGRGKGEDFDTILNLSLVKIGGSKYNTPVKNINFNICTWRHKNHSIQCCLHFWLISIFLSSSVNITSIVSSIKTNHSLIKLSLPGENKLKHS